MLLYPSKEDKAMSNIKVPAYVMKRNDLFIEEKIPLYNTDDALAFSERFRILTNDAKNYRDVQIMPDTDTDYDGYCEYHGTVKVSFIRTETQDEVDARVAAYIEKKTLTNRIKAEQAKNRKRAKNEEDKETLKALALKFNIELPSDF